MRALIIAAMIAGFAQSAFASDWRPTPELVLELCRQVEDPTSRSLLFHRSGFFFGFGSPLSSLNPHVDINNDGIPEDIKLSVLGTARMPYLSAKDLIEGWVIPPDFLNGFDDLERWFLAINVLRVSDYSFIIQARDRDFREPTLLYMIGPDNKARALCEFSSKERFVLASSSSNISSRCHALLEASKTESIAVEPLGDTDKPDFVVDEPWGRPNPTGALTADILNSGKPQRLIRLEFYSGAGCGCGVSYYDLAAEPGRPKEATDRMRQTILSAQEVHIENHGFGSHCAGGSGTRRLVEFDGKTYVVHEPGNEWNIYIRRAYPDRDGLGDGTEEACRFVRTPDVSISQTWLDWLRP